MGERPCRTGGERLREPGRSGRELAKFPANLPAAGPVKKVMDEDVDAALMRRVAAGDRAAFEAVYDDLAPMIALRLRRRCGDEALVADVLQDTFLAVWRAAATWRGDGPLAAWVWTIASRRLVDGFRRRSVRAGAEDAVSLYAYQPVASAEQAALDRSPDEVVAALTRLSPELRAVIQATVLDQLTIRETAVLLGLPEGTVKTRAHRARHLLREVLG